MYLRRSYAFFRYTYVKLFQVHLRCTLRKIKVISVIGEFFIIIYDYLIYCSFGPSSLKDTYLGNGSTRPLSRINASNTSFGTAHLSPSGSENTADGAHFLLGNVGEDALRCFLYPRDAPRRGYISTVTHTSSQAWPCFTLRPCSPPLPFYCYVACLASCFPIQYLDNARWNNPLLGQLRNSSIES